MNTSRTEQYELLRQFRQVLHQNPELSGKEIRTQARLRSFLDQYALGANVQHVGKTGVLVLFEAEKPGPCILVRADMDALPIEETNQFGHRSRNPGVSHKCGHDGHTTILAGLALRLAREKITKGKVLLLFQPAEETGEGARAVLDDLVIQQHHPTMAFALHNIPGKPMHQVLLKTGTFTPAVHSLILKFKGKTSHAAEPDQGTNPAQAIAETIMAAGKTEQPDTEDPEFGLITPVYATLGSQDYGISAGYGEAHFTIRSWTNKRMQDLTNKFLKLCDEIARRHQLQMEKSFTAVFAANENDEKAVELIRSSAGSLGLSQEELHKPMRWGEDFGLFTQLYPGAMFGLGSGENTPALHNPDYDFPDEIIVTGVEMFHSTIQEAMKAHV